MQLRWTLACLQTDPRRGTDRSGRIGVRETHAACGKTFEVRGVEPLSSRCWHIGMHGYRQTIPALVVREHQYDIWPFSLWPFNVLPFVGLSQSAQ